MTIIDTSALIDYLTDGPMADAVERLIIDADAAVSAITVFELLAGVRNAEHLQKRREVLSLMEVIPFSADIARRAAELFTSMREIGKTVDNEDLIIGATGLCLGMKVLTVNTRHFQVIPGVGLA